MANVFQLSWPFRNVPSQTQSLKLPHYHWLRTWHDLKGFCYCCWIFLFPIKTYDFNPDLCPSVVCSGSGNEWQGKRLYHAHFFKIKESREWLSLGLSFSFCRIRKLNEVSITHIDSCRTWGPARWLGMFRWQIRVYNQKIITIIVIVPHY